ncbi:MAG: penicillin-binding protein 2 [Actinobacteria bacterium]|nr:penicillin-binding protein 2 [Actinomycetota bacterium]
MTGIDAPPRLRLTLLTLLVGGLLVALFARLWFLQVLAGERYADLAESNRVRFVVLEAPRGRILAADGSTELVKNRPAQTISAHPSQLLDGTGEPKDEEAEAVLGRLEQLLGMTREEIVDRLLSRKFSPFRAVPIKEDVPPEVIFAVNEHQELFHGVVAETLPVRTYPHDTLGAHLVGYLGEISEEELADPEFEAYRPGTLVGRAGIERTYEHDLQGTEGLKKLEVNARGTVLRLFDQREPIRGNDLVTSLDLEIQAEVERILEEGIVASRQIQRTDGRFLPSTAAAAVVLDPRDGSMVAMTSWPTYDPAQFVGGVGNEYWEWLQDPANEYPLINRAIQSAYPPGSTFKIVSGAAYLEAGIVGTSTRVSCPPAWRLGNITFRNWNPRHDGTLDLPDALMRSCDTYFYELAAQMWASEERAADEGQPVVETLPGVAATFGLGRSLGVDLPGERSGVIPGREWRRTYWEQNKDVYCTKAEELPQGSYAQLINADLCRDGGRWRGGDAVNSSIGQGDVLTTPLQIAAAYAAVANGGTLYQPQVGQRVLGPDGEVVRDIAPVALDRLPLDAEELDAIQRGLEKVVMGPRGTAVTPFAGFPLDEIPVAGKTGTAELKPKVPYAWFASYAPANDPRYVVVVAVEQGGGGSQTAAPIARRILEAIFDLEPTPFVAGPKTD